MSMNGATLKTLREALGIPIAWLAEAGNVQERTARYWEARLDDVPEDVRVLFEELERVAAQAVAHEIEVIQSRIAKHGIPKGPVLLIRYQDATDMDRYQPDMAGFPVTFHATILARVRWAMQQDGIEAVIHSFDARAYEAWRRDIGQADSPTLRAQFVAMA